MVIIDPLDVYRTIIGIMHSEEIKPSAGKNALYLSVNIFGIESYRDTIFSSSTGEGTAILHVH